MEFTLHTKNNKKVHIKPKRTDFKWLDDDISLYEIGKSESDSDEYVLDWIPEYLITALNRGQKTAQVAIADYLAGWLGYK